MKQTGLVTDLTAFKRPFTYLCDLADGRLVVGDGSGSLFWIQPEMREVCTKTAWKTTEPSVVVPYSRYGFETEVINLKRYIIGECSICVGYAEHAGVWVVRVEKELQEVTA